jgi:Type II intron maturase
MRKGKAIHRPELECESDFSILTSYQLEYRGIVNYYRLAYNMRALNTLRWIMETSLLKTLAHKFKVSVSRIAEKYKAEIVEDGKKYKGFQVVIPRVDKKPLVATWAGVSLSWEIKATLEEQPPKPVWTNRSELVQRLLADYCELCGSSEDVEVHHVRAMKHLHHYPGRPKPPWGVRMIALKRKTLLLCRTCHEDVEYGRPLRRESIELMEVKALQKRANTVILESRMP